jgi:hypothetical protein
MRLSGNCTDVTEVIVIVPESPSSNAIVPLVLGDVGESVRLMLVTLPVPVTFGANVPAGGFGLPVARAEVPGCDGLRLDPSAVAISVKQPVVGADADVI